MVAFVFAMEEEAKDFIALFPDVIVHENNFCKILLARVRNSLVVIAISGVGKISAAATITYLLTNFQVTKVFNLGSCGSLNEKLNTLDVIFCNQFYDHDIDLTAFGYEYGQLPKANTNLGQLTKLGQEVQTKISHLSYSVLNGSLSSGDVFITKHNYGKYEIFTKQKIDCVDMETSSLVLICEKNKVDYVVIKIISDRTLSPGSTNQFKENLMRISVMIREIALECLDYAGK